ncbi:MAG: hypothetical protein WA324_11165 [Bryobacteraceae bacterium]
MASWRKLILSLLASCLVSPLLLAQGKLASGPPKSSTHALLQKIREHVFRQVEIGGNYMCVQSAERQYFQPEEPTRYGCDHHLEHPEMKTEIMTDRLRLDVAVSDNHEIYSWFGQDHFGTGAIDEIVTTGPITSGGFGGFLRNIFLAGGIEFIYQGHVVLNGIPEDVFDYNVPLARSTYAVTTEHGPVLVAFEGSAFANSNTFELSKLIVEIPKGPADSSVCYARSLINYQIQHISGNDVLIPSSFDFKVEGTDHTLTDSKFEYRSCHAFTGESTISYAISDVNNPQSNTARTIVKGPLPPHQFLSIALRTPINDQDSYTGDPVQGLLTRAVKLNKSEGVISKGALVSGIIKQLQFYPKPHPHYLVDVLFTKIVDGKAAYTTRAIHLATAGDAVRPYVSHSSARISTDPLDLHGKHFELKAGYKSEWITTTVKPTHEIEGR